MNHLVENHLQWSIYLFINLLNRTFVGNNFYNLKELIEKGKIEEEIPISRNSVVAGVLSVTLEYETPNTIYTPPTDPTDPIGFYLTIKRGETISLLPQTGRQITFFHIRFQDNVVRTHDDVIGGTNPIYNDCFYFPLDDVDFEQDFITFQFFSSNIIGDTEIGRSYLNLENYKDGKLYEDIKLDIYFMDSVMRGVFLINLQLIYPDSVRSVKNEEIKKEEKKTVNPRELLDNERALKKNAKGLKYHEPLSIFNSFGVTISQKLLDELSNVKVLNDDSFVKIYNSVANEKNAISQKYLDIQIYNECYHCHKSFFCPPAIPAYDCKFCGKPQKTPAHPAPLLLGQLIPFEDDETVCRRLLEEYYMLFDEDGERVITYDECRGIYEALGIDNEDEMNKHWKTFVTSDEEDVVNMKIFIDFLLNRIKDLGYGKILPRYIQLLRQLICSQKSVYIEWTCPHDFHINDMTISFFFKFKYS